MYINTTYIASLRSSGVKKAEEQSKEFDVSELITNLRDIKKEEQDLLSKRNELQSIELKLRNQAIIEFGEKKNTIERLKVQSRILTHLDQGSAKRATVNGQSSAAESSLQILAPGPVLQF